MIIKIQMSGMVLLTVCEDGGQTGSDGNVIPSNCDMGMRHQHQCVSN